LSNHYLVPYNYLHSVNSWTVENLIFESTQEEDRTPLKNFVTFNKERVSPGNLDPDNDYPYVEIKSISLYTGTIEPTYINGANLPARAKLIGRKGDILISIVRPERGIIAIVPSELDGCVVSNTFVVLTPQKISPEYLYLLLKDKDVRREFSLMARGTTTPTLGIKDLKNYSLPLKKVPKVMEKSANELYGEWKRQGKENRPLNDIVEDIFKKVLLKVEVIEEEGEQDQYITLPYEELIDRWDVQYHIDHMTRKVLWSVQTKKLDNLGEVKIGAPLPNKSEAEGNVPYIRVQDLDDDSLYVKNDELVYFGEEINEKARGILRKGDILVSRVGNFGRSALVQPELDGALANHNLAIFRPNDQVILPKYLAFFFKTRWANLQFNTYATGLFLQSNFLKEVLVPVPSLSQQRFIVESIDQEFSANKVEDLERETLRFTHQIDCVESVSDALISGNRRALVQIPIGAGKTSILIAVLRRLFNSGQVKKVLYLTDRRVIAEQFRQICKDKLPEHHCYLMDLFKGVDFKKGIFAGQIDKVSIDLAPLFDLVILDGYHPKWLRFANREWAGGFVVGVASIPFKLIPNYHEVLKVFELEEPTYQMDIIDPSAGSAQFLVEAMKYIQSGLEKD
jgi:type I restriction enzyme, S subunit